MAIYLMTRLVRLRGAVGLFCPAAAEEYDTVDPTPPDRGATAEFIGQLSRCQRRLYAFIYALVRHAADAEDILQECNLVLWRKADEFQPGTDFMAWAGRIAQFQVMAFRKKQARRAREHFDDVLIAQLADEAQERLKQFDQRQQALLECLRELRPEQRTLVARRYEPGGSVNEIARSSNRSPKAVSEALRRIREALMRCIERRIALENG
jgi:RNA polymerase sigma-70 factor (ECF subfamily)